MKWIGKLRTRHLAALFLLALLACTLIGTGLTAAYIVWRDSQGDLYPPIVCHLFKPWAEFSQGAVSPPSYLDESSWAARPGKRSPADFSPSGWSDAEEVEPVNVFVVHPTSLYGGSHWNSPLDRDSAAEQNVQWILANQASVFSSVGNVYAPRYRDAVIFAYMPCAADSKERAFELAYGDVERAFDYFIEHSSKDQPFIIASHSQGTLHAQSLVRRLGGTALANRMIVAYLIGGGVPHDFTDEIEGIHDCAHPRDINCVVHWATVADGTEFDYDGRRPFLCTNPISWRRDEVRAPESQHRGAVAVSGEFNSSYLTQRRRQHHGPPALGPALPNLAWAQCKNGILVAKEQSDHGFPEYMGRGPNKSYHMLDYSLFHMDIRHNVRERIAAYRSERPPPDTAEPASAEDDPY